jgi:hypothetical protein
MGILNELNRIKNLMNLSEALTNNPFLNFVSEYILKNAWDTLTSNPKFNAKSILDGLDDVSKGTIRQLAKDNNIIDYTSKDLDGLIDELIQGYLTNDEVTKLIKVLSKNKVIKSSIVNSIEEDRAFSNALLSAFEMEEKGIIKRQDVINKLEELYGKEIGDEVYSKMKIDFDPTTVISNSRYTDIPTIKMTVKNVGDLVTAIDDVNIKTLFNEIGVENVTNFLNSMESKTKGITVDSAWFQKELQKILNATPDAQTKKEILNNVKSFLSNPSLKTAVKGLKFTGKWFVIGYLLSILYAAYTGYNRKYQKELAKYLIGNGYITFSDAQNLQSTNPKEYQRLVNLFDDQIWKRGEGFWAGGVEMVKSLPIPSSESELNSLDFGGGSSTTTTTNTQPTTPNDDEGALN